MEGGLDRKQTAGGLGWNDWKQLRAGMALWGDGNVQGGNSDGYSTPKG